jgi:hypothetical protein
VPSAAGVCLAPRLGPGGRRPALRRRAALGLALLALAATVLVATGRIRVPRIRLAGALFARIVPRLQASPRAAPPEPAVVRPPAQPSAPLRAGEARPFQDRVVATTHAAALFAQRSWYVAPPPPPPAPPLPPPEPTAPPLPYTFVGSYAPQGEAPVFFLARGDRVIDAHVGDKLDGVYQFESAAGGQLVFVYLPLKVRQNLVAGATP